VLLVWFTLPIGDAESAENVLDLCTDFNLGAIRDKFCRGAASSYIVFKCINELTIRFHALNISNQGLRTNEKLGTCLPTWNIR